MASAVNSLADSGRVGNYFKSFRSIKESLRYKFYMWDKLAKVVIKIF